MIMYDLGIVGGMGPEATSEIFKRIIHKTKANCDQEHMRIVVLNNTSIPDRTNYLLGVGKNPLPYINESLNDLMNLGVKCFIIPCNTAHALKDEFIYGDMKFINMIDETIKVIKKDNSNKDIYVLCTLGTYSSNVYKNSKEIGSLKINYPGVNIQEMIMDLIIKTKAKYDYSLCLNEFKKILDIFNKETLFVLACTELSLYYEDLKNDYCLVDAMNCIVDAVIKNCGYEMVEN